MHKNSQEEDELFFVSMTDIMVGLLFIFILIIMYFAVQARIDQNRIQTLQLEIDGFQEISADFGSYNNLITYQRGVQVQQRNILRWLQGYLNRQGVTGVDIIEEQGVIRLPEGILFDTGEFEFVEGSQAELTAKMVSTALSEILPCSVLNSEGKQYIPSSICNTAFYNNTNMGFVQSIYIEGHTDSVNVGEFGLPGDPNLTSNLKLSARRSTNTFETMTNQSPSISGFYGPVDTGDSLRFEPILASSAFGESRPSASNDTIEGRRANRRIDIRIVMYSPINVKALEDLADHIGFKIEENNSDAEIE